MVSILALSRLAAFDSNNPAADGYQLVFNSLFLPGEVDLGDTGNPGFKWYVRKPFGWASTPASNFTFGSNGVTITPTERAAGYHLATAYPYPYPNGSGYRGTVFGPGWYVEAQVAFDPTVVNLTNGWPAFWALAWKGMTVTPQDYWAEQGANFRHNVENDMFEYNQNDSSHLKYGATLHDWAGTVPFQAPPSVHARPGNVTLGADPNWNHFHRIGQLWVKGTAANGYDGFVTNFFDGVPSTTYSWVWRVQSNASLDPQNGPLPVSYRFARIDDFSYVIILGSGVAQPFDVKSVQVWQLPDINGKDLKYDETRINYGGFEMDWNHIAAWWAELWGLLRQL